MTTCYTHIWSYDHVLMRPRARAHAGPVQGREVVAARRAAAKKMNADECAETPPMSEVSVQDVMCYTHIRSYDHVLYPYMVIQTPPMSEVSVQGGTDGDTDHTH